MEFLQSSFLLSMVGTSLIQWIKGSPLFPKVQEGATAILRVISAIIAALATSGILVVSNWQGAEGTWSLMITGLCTANVLAFLWAVLGGFCEQHFLFKILKAAKKPIQALPAGPKP